MCTRATSTTDYKRFYVSYAPVLPASAAYAIRLCALLHTNHYLITTGGGRLSTRLAERSLTRRDVAIRFSHVILTRFTILY